MSLAVVTWSPLRGEFQPFNHFGGGRELAIYARKVNLTYQPFHHLFRRLGFSKLKVEYQ